MSEQIPYITSDIVESATKVKESADDFLKNTEDSKAVEYVKFLRDATTSGAKSSYPVKEGAPTGPYITSLLDARKQLEKVEESVRGGKIPVQKDDEPAAETAINLFQSFQMTFMFNLMQFEEGLSEDQRW